MRRIRRCTGLGVESVAESGRGATVTGNDACSGALHSRDLSALTAIRVPTVCCRALCLSGWRQVVAEVKAILGAYLPRGYLTSGAKKVVSNHRHVYTPSMP